MNDIESNRTNKDEKESICRIDDNEKVSEPDKKKKTGVGWSREIQIHPCCLVLLLIAFNLLIYHYITPDPVKKMHKENYGYMKKAADEQLLALTKSITESKTGKALRLDELQKKLEAQSELMWALTSNSTQSLADMTDSIIDSVTFVSRGHHEEQVDQHIKMVDDLKKAKQKLSSEMSTHQKTIEDLKKSIQETHKEKEKLKAQILTMKVDITKFNPEGSMELGPGAWVSCGARANYLTSTYGISENEAKEGVMTQEPVGCTKK